MYQKIPKTERQGILSADETLSRLINSNLSKSSQERIKVGSFLTDSELQALREEMIRDGAYMKGWLRSKARKTIR
ncbi:hypothetical protein [Pseudomonas amygdali]|uniref:hypothetical protein n=1 Tax=Pseudomonas amygdali TaxID=47877 RepID=UPI001FB60899|nr:hypothetical protein [Pseudomonas amygdali]UPT37846.1 hypothetical protein LT107_04055 [Pseudomonas amygdali pv. loropetali]